jgi:pimeloyl-ACP methyl ester carboxylesterase
MPSVPRVTVQGVEIHFEGNHPRTVVMLHGWPDSYRLWDQTVESLKDRYCCVRFTLPGFDVAGPARPTSLDEMCDLLRTIVDEVSPGVPVTLLLHDWGCIFGYEFAARHPDRVARIVAVDIGDHNSDALKSALSAKQRWQVFGYQIWLALAWNIGGRLGSWMTRSMARALRCRTDPAAIGWQMNYPYAMRWFGTLGGFGAAAQVSPACPMFYIYGERKLFMFHSPGWLAELAARPDCAVQAFPTGHWVMVQQPAQFSRCVRQWLTASDRT